MKYLTWNKTPHLLSVGTWWGSILKWILEFLTCFEKMFQLSAKSPDLESGFLGKSILKNGWICVCVPVLESVLNHFWAVHLWVENIFTDPPTMYQWSGELSSICSMCSFSSSWQSSGWCWSCASVFQHPPSTAAEINLEAISPISNWEGNSSHSVKCSYWSGSNQRNPFEMKFQWSSKTCFFSKFTVQNLLDNAIKCYVSHGTDLRVPFKWISVSSLQKLQCQVRYKLISKIQVWCKVILVTSFQQSL